MCLKEEIQAVCYFQNCGNIYRGSLLNFYVDYDDFCELLKDLKEYFRTFHVDF